MDYTIKNTLNINQEKIIELYKDAGWSKYVEDIDKLMRAFEKSLVLLSAWKDNELLGLVRIVGDGETILFIQDLLIRKSSKRKGIASALIEKSLEMFPNVRQKVLITDNNPEAVGFYNKIGFKESDKLNIKAFVNFEM